MSSVSVCTRIAEVPAAEWDSLSGAQCPFLRHAFLDALEQSGSVGGDSGWTPRHLLLHSGSRLLAAMPCYAKTHSYGEYVFDWSWAEAYSRNGRRYYPKLLSAVPFTPSTGPRLLLAEGVSAVDALAAFREKVDEQLASGAFSSWHLLFPEATLSAACHETGMLRRTGVQFHWHNAGYRDFEDFLARFASRKRKQIRRERRQVEEQGLEIRRLRGPEIDTATWDRFHLFYQMTYARRSGHGGYLSREFFHHLGREMPGSVLLVLALREGEAVAGALNLVGEDALYGRYWGCTEAWAQLHFELCYYQGIEFCIEQGLSRFDAGAQGEHKIARGFEPVITESWHLIADPRFRAAIADFLLREAPAVEAYRADAASTLPFKSTDED
ncbi:MAG: GNAT family N-acetyltransferase [Gammaproteobacteria bacterium]